MRHRTARSQWTPGLAGPDLADSAPSLELSLAPHEIAALATYAAEPALWAASEGSEATGEERALALALARLRARVLAEIGVDEDWGAFAGVLDVLEAEEAG